MLGGLQRQAGADRVRRHRAARGGRRRAARRRRSATWKAQLAGLDDAYALASPPTRWRWRESESAGAAHDRLMAIAQRRATMGCSWGDEPQPQPLATPGARPAHAAARPRAGRGARRSRRPATPRWRCWPRGDKLERRPGGALAGLAAQRQGGFGSTQDTVVALQALTSAADQPAAPTSTRR